MSYAAYKVVHLLGLMMLFLSLGGLAMLGALDADKSKSKALRGALSMFHGVGLLVLLVAGFGLLARLNLNGPDGWSTWVYLKVVLWLVFGAAVVPLKRMPHLARVWMLAFVALGTFGGWLAINKPF